MVQVQIKDGILEGEVVNNKFGGKFYSFKGIPYAEPPVGDLRFKAPRPPKPWNGVRGAKEFGNVSYQVDTYFKTGIKGSEDCLYLNVYSPQVTPSKSLPVMVWIHGGGFTFGSGNDDAYGPEFLVRHDVVIVTLNYRLEVLGFLCLDTEDAPGNAALKDQVAALKWVQNNISHFGGDPSNVTIFGESTGSVSVSYHLISPMSKGLFKRAICQSGTVGNAWSFCPLPLERAMALARHLGLDSSDPKELYEFFKTQPAENLVNVRAPFTYGEAFVDTFDIHFCVVSEKQFDKTESFFYGNPIDALRNGIHEGVDVMTGFNEHEGVFSILLRGGLERIKDKIRNYYEFFVPLPILRNCLPTVQYAVGKQLKHFYLKDKPLKNVDRVIDFCTFEDMAFGIIQSQKILAKSKNNKGKFFFYKFTCKSELNVFTNAFGLGDVVGSRKVTNHIDDIHYLFYMKMFNFEIDKESATFRMIDNVTKLWTNFSKFGNPTPDSSLGVTWSPYTSQNQEYLELGEQLMMSSHVCKEQVEIYEEIFRKYCPQCIA